jgi:nitroreductase
LDFERAVPLDVVVECLRIATHAPNARNEQDWRWIVVADTNVRRDIATVLAKPGGTPGRRTDRGIDEGVVGSAAYLRAHIADVPVLVFACLRGVITAEANHRQRADFYASIIPAVWSFQLALRARGLGSVLTTEFLAHEEGVRRVLGIPNDVTPVIMTPVAYFRGEMGPPSRRPVEEVAYVDRWGQELISDSPGRQR